MRISYIAIPKMQFALHKNKKRFSVVCFLLAAFGATQVNAQPVAYAEVAGNLVLQSVDEQDFRLGSTELRAGVYVHRQIALEAFASHGVVDDDEANLSQEVGLGYGGGLRFESHSRKGTKAFILLGFSSHELELSQKVSNVSLSKERFESFSYGLGLEEQLLDAESSLFVNVRWQRHYSAGGVGLDTVGAAIRYAF